MSEKVLSSLQICFASYIMRGSVTAAGIMFGFMLGTGVPHLVRGLGNKCTLVEGWEMIAVSGKC